MRTHQVVTESLGRLDRILNRAQNETETHNRLHIPNWVRLQKWDSKYIPLRETEIGQIKLSQDYLDDEMIILIQPKQINKVFTPLRRFTLDAFGITLDTLLYYINQDDLFQACLKPNNNDDSKALNDIYNISLRLYEYLLENINSEKALLSDFKRINCNLYYNEKDAVLENINNNASKALLRTKLYLSIEHTDINNPQLENEPLWFMQNAKTTGLKEISLGLEKVWADEATVFERYEMRRYKIYKFTNYVNFVINKENYIPLGLGISPELRTEYEEGAKDLDIDDIMKVPEWEVILNLISEDLFYDVQIKEEKLQDEKIKRQLAYYNTIGLHTFVEFQHLGRNIYCLKVFVHGLENKQHCFKFYLEKIQ